MTTSSPFTDAHDLTGYAPNLTNNDHLIVWTEAIGAQAACGPQSLPGSSVQNFSEEAIDHNLRNLVEEQHVYWRKQCRHALIFQQTSFERAARDQVHVAVAQATEMSGARVRTEKVLSTIEQSKLGLLIK